MCIKTIVTQTNAQMHNTVKWIDMIESTRPNHLYRYTSSKNNAPRLSGSVYRYCIVFKQYHNSLQPTTQLKQDAVEDGRLRPCAATWRSRPINVV